LLQQLAQLREQGELRDSQLMAMRESLNALEQTGTSGRQNLVEEITHLEQLTEQRLSALDSQINNVSSAWDEQLSAQRDAIEARFVEVEASVAEIEAPAGQEALETLEQEWSQRLNTLESDVRQVRQSQLAFSAQLEMLR
jgi:uncharacterized protein YicC (UPF0701 family)